MLFRTQDSYTLPKLPAEGRCPTPSLLIPDTLSARDQQIRLYCQTLISLIHDFHIKSPKSAARLQKSVQRILGIETRIDLIRGNSKSCFERNLQLFICVVEHRLRSLAADSSNRFRSIVDRLQLLLIESGSTRTLERAHAMTKLKDFIMNVI
uniref:Uncharacterized protein n=1 Tax=Haemonchus contortus TaxID=6289 RepID=A0A7I4YQE4_HAECO